MSAPRSRAYAGAADLRRMQAGISRAFGRTHLHIGDLAWSARHHTHRDMSLHVRLWEDDAGELIAWSSLLARGEVILFAAPGQEDPGLYDDVLSTIDAAAAEAAAAGDVPPKLSTFITDSKDDEAERVLVNSLLRNGYHDVPSEGGMLTRDLRDIPQPTLPAGLVGRTVTTPAEVIGRVEAGRAAFAPSEMTLEKYQRVRRTWPYRAGLDRIALTAGGEVVAFCTAWIDVENAAGLLEPVGTVPTHQRRGLATAVCLEALLALRAAGARTARVSFATPAAGATYRSIGFMPAGRDIAFEKDAPPPP